MKKTFLTALMVIACSLHAEHYQNRSQVFYPSYDDSKPGRILAAGEHELRGIGSDGIIEIEDGTQFKAVLSHRTAMKRWKCTDLITFCPNPYPFGGSEFYVLNESNGEYFKANIWASPALKNPHALRLEEIDRERQEVVLSISQGMRFRWKIDPDDFEYLRHWKIGDVIVIGKNNNWFSRYFSDYEHILVSYSATEDILYVRGTPKPL